MKKKELSNIVVGVAALRGVVDIPGKERSKNPLVQKSRKLLDALFHSGYTLLQQRLIDCYLRRIDTHQPQYREVVFEKAELEKLLGGIRIKTDDIIAALDLIKEKTLQIAVNRETGEITDIILFSRAEIGYFEGRLLIALECSETATPYLFNPEKGGYVKYPLKTSLAIADLHTYLLYMYLLSNRFRGHWQEDVAILRYLLGCENTYPQYFLFNEKILKIAHAKITADCRLQYKYRAIKKVDRTLISFQMINNERKKKQGVASKKTCGEGEKESKGTENMQQSELTDDSPF